MIILWHYAIMEAPVIEQERRMDELVTALKAHFGYEAFLPGQREVIAPVLAGRDAFALMPTGGGKSLIYQLSALMRPGLTVVVSPLIALMQDQVDRLQANGIAATFVNSALSGDERTRRERAALEGRVKLLYLAPERLMTGSIIGLLERIQASAGLALLAVDEAHCISEWGHDFRPEYRQIGELRERFTDVPLLALTATATTRVRQDIVAQLRLRDPFIHVASFDRPNLRYEVRPKDKHSYHELRAYIRAHPDQAIIVYCHSRKTVDDLAATLNDDRIRALPYHAGMEADQRATNQRRFIQDDAPVLVATIAFGMGIAKPDVRAVIHYDLPRNLEGYYQESGRAGRDGQPADCILFFSFGDKAKIEYLIDQKTEPQEQQVARRQLAQVIAFAQGQGCRRRALLAYFGEDYPQPDCGNCDNCLHPPTREDRTTEAQKLLSCIGRTGERFGLRHIVAILRGAQTQKIRDLRHDQLTVYGVGKELSEDDWLHIGRALIEQGIVREAGGEFPTLALTPAAWQILRGQARALLPARPVRLPPRDEPAAASAAVLLDEASAGLFHHLRDLRKRLADEQNVPPYVIFADAALRAMAQQRPQTREQFARIPGVGQRKLESFFTIFTDAIRAYCMAHDLPMEIAPDPAPPRAERARVATHLLTWELFQQGKSLDAIAAERDLRPSTLRVHLIQAIKEGREVDRDRLVPPERFAVIAPVIRRLGFETMSPVKEALGDEYNYDEIFFVKTFLLVDMQGEGYLHR
jgi:ATP-dependent DNA helicase RecQ